MHAYQMFRPARIPKPDDMPDMKHDRSMFFCFNYNVSYSKIPTTPDDILKV